MNDAFAPFRSFEFYLITAGGCESKAELKHALSSLHAIRNG